MSDLKVLPVVFCDDEGEGLRPLTCSAPKALVAMLGKPCVCYTLELLGGSESVLLVTGYKGGEVRERLGDEYCGAALEYSEGFLPSSSYDAFMLLDGGAVFPVNPSAAMKQFEASECDGMIFCVNDDELADVMLDENGYAESIGNGGTELRFTGTGILRTEALAALGTVGGLSCRELLLNAVSSGKKMAVFRGDCFYASFDSPKECIDAQISMLSSQSYRNAAVTGSYAATELSGLCYIGSNVSIGSGCRISGSVLCDNAVIGDNVRLFGAVVSVGAHLGDRVTCNGAIIAEGAGVAAGCEIYENAVIGSGARLGRDCVVGAGVRVWNGKRLPAGTRGTSDVKYGYMPSFYLDDNGIGGETGSEFTAELAVLAGRALGSLSESPCVAVGDYGGRASNALAAAFSAGLCEAGASAWRLESCTQPQLAFASARNGMDYEAHITADSFTRLRITSHGFPLSAEDERRLDYLISVGAMKRTRGSSYGEQHLLSGEKRQYVRALLSGYGKNRMNIACAGGLARQLIPELFTSAQDDCTFQLSTDGKAASAYSRESGFLSHERLLMICIAARLKNGDVTVPWDFPSAVRELAQDGRMVRTLRRGERPDAGMNIFYDGLALCCELGRIVAEYCESRMGVSQGAALAALSDGLPEFGVSSRIVLLRQSPRQAIRLLNEGLSPERLALLKFFPGRTGRSLRIIAEAVSSETAAELCTECEKMLSSGK